MAAFLLRHRLVKSPKSHFLEKKSQKVAKSVSEAPRATSRWAGQVVGVGAISGTSVEPKFGNEAEEKLKKWPQ